MKTVIGAEFQTQTPVYIDEANGTVAFDIIFGGRKAFIQFR